MKQGNIWFLVGMATQAVIAGSLAAMGSITLNAGQQTTAAGFFVIISFVWLLITRQLNKLILGMGIQALSASVLALAGLIDLNPTQQFIAAGLYGLVILVFVLLRQDKRIA